MPPSTPLSWIPYTPPPGSYVELWADGTFRLEGHEALWTQEEAVSLHNTVLAASKEAGQGEPLSLHLFRGAKPLHVLLCYDDLDGSGVAQWFRHEPKASTTATPGNTASQKVMQPLAKALPTLPRVNESWFKVGFFVFLFWYLFAHHQVFRGVDATERYPMTVPRSSEDDYTPPLPTYRP